MKHCHKCNTTKSFSSFYKNKGKKDGYATLCIECDKIKAKLYRVANADFVKQRSQAYHQKNKEVINTKKKQWYLQNKETKLIKNKQWFIDNKDRRNAHLAKRRAVKTQAAPKWLTKEHLLEIQEFYTMAKELEKVFPWKQHVDHIVPLLGKDVCGLHVPWNLQILSVKANLEKGNSFVSS